MSAIPDGPRRDYLRGLAADVRRISQEPVFEEKKRLWIRKNGLQKTRPLVLCTIPDNLWREIIPENSIRFAESPWREIERSLIQRIYRWEHIRDDEIITDKVYLPLHYAFSDWIEGRRRPQSENGRGAEAFHPDIFDYGDWGKVRMPELQDIDSAANARDMDMIGDTLGDLLEVIGGEPFSSDTDQYVKGWGLSGIDILCELRGLEAVYMDLADNPLFVDDAMAFICEGLDGYLDAMEGNRLLRLNNNDFTKSTNSPLGSNGLAITDGIPGQGSKHDEVKCRDLWGYSMAQEFVGVSPEMHEKYVLSHQRKLGERFGLLCYGCCEPNDRKWASIFKTFRNLREVSVSHVADLDIAAEAIGANYVFSWKPNSTILPYSDEEAIRRQLADGMGKARDCHLVVSLRDNLTLGGRPELLSRWTRTAMELAEKA